MAKETGAKVIKAIDLPQNKEVKAKREAKKKK